MIDLGPHAVFIVSAYLGVAIVTLFLILYTLADAQKQARRLAELEAMGVKRRSAGKTRRRV